MMSGDQPPEGGADPEPDMQPDTNGRPGVGDATMRVVILCVAGSAVAMTLLALLAFGVRSALGVALGGAIATANLYVFARIVDAFLSRRGRTAPWTIIAMLKLVVLLGGVWLILKSDLVSGLALVVGYASLVVGITLGTLFGPKPPEDDGGRAPGDSG
jgi:hypothetical protein